MITNRSKEETGVMDMSGTFEKRLHKHMDELKWLYIELYNNYDMLAELIDEMRSFYEERDIDLKKRDELRERDGGKWYKSNDMLGMMLYIDNFAGNINGVSKKIDYIEKANVNYVHLMPFLDTTEGKSDGGYAVSDFRKVRKDLGTMEDLEKFTKLCHKKNINVCMDYVMNHTSEDHEWARRARTGDGEYMSRYYFVNNQEIINEYDRTVPEVFPTTAPGNFTFIPEIDHYVMTTFYPYQWDLNYKNPRVFNEMMYNFLYLANKGIDIMRIDAVPYIWKELGTTCRNLLQVHTIVRMMRMICEIVCPGVILLGEVVMEPEKVVPYFGYTGKPECHMLYNVTTMASTWNSIATRDIRLLKKQLDIVAGLPKEYIFLNYLRCHDDIGWGLDYETLGRYGMEQISHKRYLNDFFLGYAGGSNSRGELYNDDPVTMDARFCGTTASMCGIERALEEQNPWMLREGINMDLMLHAYMFMQSGIPVLYSGDEIGQLNDNDYKNDVHKAGDSRYIHRGKFDWDKAKNIDKKGTVEELLFDGLLKLEKIRKTEKAFVSQADMWTVDTGDNGCLCIGRYYAGDKIMGLFNFTEHEVTAWNIENDGEYRDLLTGKIVDTRKITLSPYGFYLLKKRDCA